MSTLKVEVVRVEEVLPHPNADRLEIARIKGWQCVVGKGAFRTGDKGFYFPIDSVLPEPLLEELFRDSKIKPPSRIRTIKLRGALSQGLLVKKATMQSGWGDDPAEWSVGEDVTEHFGVTKYEPPVKDVPVSMRGNARKQHPNFHKYTDIENWKNYPNVFTEDDWVTVTEKIHGTNFRCGWVPFSADTWWKKVKAYFGFAPKWEFVYGSRNVQLSEGGRTYYGDDVYGKIVRQYDLQSKLQYGEVLYGEIYGDGIQKGYTYGCGAGEQKLAAFEVMKDDVYLNPFGAALFLEERDIPTAPMLYAGPYIEDLVKAHAEGPSVLHMGQTVREGVVIRQLSGDNDHHPLLGRKILKLINDDYLLRDQSDWH